MSESLRPHGLQQASLSFTISQSLFKLMSIKSMMPSNHLILCHPLLLPSIFLSIRVFSSESVLHISWPKYWSFSLSISPSNEYSGLISFRMDWSDLLAVQETLKNLLQHHSSKASIMPIYVNFRGHLCTGGGGCGLVAKSSLTLATLWSVAFQVPLSVGFHRQEYWTGLPFPSPRDLLNPGIEPMSLGLLHWQADSLMTEPPVSIY